MNTQQEFALAKSKGEELLKAAEERRLAAGRGGGGLWGVILRFSRVGGGGR